MNARGGGRPPPVSAEHQLPACFDTVLRLEQHLPLDRHAMLGAGGVETANSVLNAWRLGVPAEKRERFPTGLLQHAPGHLQPALDVVTDYRGEYPRTIVAVEHHDRRTLAALPTTGEGPAAGTAQ